MALRLLSSIRNIVREYLPELVSGSVLVLHFVSRGGRSGQSDNDELSKLTNDYFYEG